MSDDDEREDRIPPPHGPFERSTRSLRRRLRSAAFGNAVLVAAFAMVVSAYGLIAVVQGRSFPDTWEPPERVARSQGADRKAVIPAAVAAHRAGPASLPSAIPRPVSTMVVDDSGSAANGSHFEYYGRWQHLTNMADGRSAGTSSRSFRAGSSASIRFSGRRLQLFGVRGPNGGTATLLLDGKTYGPLRFYAPAKQTAVLVYTTSHLTDGEHNAWVVVSAPSARFPRRRFVNLDGAAYVPASRGGAMPKAPSP